MNPTDKGQIDRRKSTNFVDVDIFYFNFTCMKASQERSENPKKQLNLKAFIPFNIIVGKWVDNEKGSLSFQGKHLWDGNYKGKLVEAGVILMGFVSADSYWC